MEDNKMDMKKRRIIAAWVACGSIAVILFLCIFSLYHLPERDPVETPEVAENAADINTPVQDFTETNDIMTSSQQQVSEMLGDLEMQYANAKVNDEPMAAEQAGARLALAYWKAGQTQQAKDLLNSLIQTYSYDTTYVAKCKELMATFDKKE